MKHVLILGAGKSSSYLIRHLIENKEVLNSSITILDIQLSHLDSYKSHSNVHFIEIPSGDINEYARYIEQSYLTISMLPAYMHIEIARMCLQYGSHLLTPSYISAEMQALSNEAQTKKLVFLNELGFDPGIDHMTTMKIYYEIIQQGGKLTSYRSYAGGLIAPSSDTNPWHYKFTWNPRNVILAGQGGDIKYKKDGQVKTLTYQQLFENSELLKLSNGMVFDAYANRDSLKYEKLYGWHEIQTLLRGTLRIHGFCEAWNILVNLGITDDNNKSRHFAGKTYTDFFSSFLNMSMSEFLSKQNDSVKAKLNSIGFSDTTSIINTDDSAAEILQSILEDKWKLEPEDKDWIVMVHYFEYELENKKFEIESYFSLEGESSQYTAMSKTVGMPIAFAAEMILRNEVNTYGVLMPTIREIYQPLLIKLKEIGVTFKDTIKEI